MIKHVHHRALGTDLAVGFGETQTHISKGAVGVVGQTIDNHHAATGPITFITGHRKIFTTGSL